jgi:hypothetical protein
MTPVAFAPDLRVLPGLAGRVLVDLARDRGAELIVA